MRALRIICLGFTSVGIAIAGCSAADSTGPAFDAGPPIDAGGSDAHPTTGDASTKDGAGGTDASVDAGPPPTCPTAVTWSAGTAIAISTSDDDTFAAITPDELTIAWTTDVSATVVIHYADRATATDAFGAPQTISAAQGSFAAGQVALSSDGLRMALVADTAKSLSVITRASRTVPFDATPAAGEFDSINLSVSGGEVIEEIGDPVFGSHDTSFYYSVYGGGLTYTALGSSRPDTSSWPAGAALQGAALVASADQRRHPTGIASDDRTLFFWDDVSGTEKMGWRTTPSGSFDQVVDIGSHAGAQTNSACKAIYYSAACASSVDLFVAKAL